MKKAIYIILITVLLATANAFAVENFKPVTVEIKGQHIVENNESLKTGRHTFLLTAKDNAPMPDGADSVTINSNEEFAFDKLTFDKQGTYVYTISRKLTQSKDLEEDDSVYTCTITVFNDGTSVMVIKKDGVEGKPDKIVYTDKYVKKTQVKTGDNYDIFAFGGIFLILITLIILIKRRNHEKDF